jgi:hypothetical protein
MTTTPVKVTRGSNESFSNCAAPPTSRVPPGRSIDQSLDTNPEMIAYSRYTMQLKPYFDAFGRERVLPVFFERLTAQPRETLEVVCRFIGHAGHVQWFEDASDQNVSSERLRRSPVRDAIVNLPGLRALRHMLVPRSWRDRIKGLWMMKQRPQLSEANVARLREIFDEDLATLGSWLGRDDLCCDNFKQVAKTTTLTWNSPARAPAA